MARFIEDEGIILTEEEKELFKKFRVEQSKQPENREIPEMAKYFLSFGFKN